MDPTLFMRIGGEAAVEAAVNIFYQKFVKHPEIQPFFEGISMPEQEDKMRKFLRFSMGGGGDYGRVSREQIRAAHAPLVEKGLNKQHFALFEQLMEESLMQLQIPSEIVDEFLTFAMSYRNDVLLLPQEEPETTRIEIAK